MNAEEYAKAVSSTVASLMKRGYVPCILVGFNYQNGEVLAQSIDPAVFTPEITKHLMCKVVVSDILGHVPELPKQPPESEGA